MLTNLKLNQINNASITSPNLGFFDTIFNFSNNIVSKDFISADCGYMIIDQYMAIIDFLNCSRQTLKALEFHQRDGSGRLIDLKGHRITFSILF